MALTFSVHVVPNGTTDVVFAGRSRCRKLDTIKKYMTELASEHPDCGIYVDYTATIGSHAISLVNGKFGKLQRPLSDAAMAAYIASIGQCVTAISA